MKFQNASRGVLENPFKLELESFIKVDVKSSTVIPLMPVLLELQKYSGTHRNFVIELESLHQTLILTKLTIQRYSDTSLSQSLVNLITPEIKQCLATLQKLLDCVNGVWLVFGISTVGGLCHQIWCGEWDEDQFPPLRKKLSHSRQMLQEFLVTLYLYIFLFLTHFTIS